MGSRRSNKRSYFQLCPISKIKVSNCWSWTSDQKCPWWPLHPTLSSGSKGQKKVKFWFQKLRCQIVGLGATIKSVHGDLFVWPFVRGQKVKKGQIGQLCPISKIKVSNCRSWNSDQKWSWWPLRLTLHSGSKGQIGQLCPISKIKVSNYRSWNNNQKS